MLSEQISNSQDYLRVQSQSLVFVDSSDKSVEYSRLLNQSISLGSAFSATDNLGNTYSLRKELIKAGQVKSQLWRSTVTNAGTLTSVTISWTTNVTVFSRVGT